MSFWSETFLATSAVSRHLQYHGFKTTTLFAQVTLHVLKIKSPCRTPLMPWWIVLTIWETDWWLRLSRFSSGTTTSIRVIHCYGAINPIATPWKTQFGNRKSPFVVGDTSSNGCFSIVMLVFRGILAPCCYPCHK